MNTIKPLDAFTALDLKKEIKMSFKDYKTKDLSTHTHHIINLLSELGKKHTIDFFRTIDSLFPGLSFHFIMEARHTYQNKACELLLLRVSYFIRAFPEKEIFAPMRKRLIHALLFENITAYKEFFNDLKEGVNYIENITSLNSDEKKKLQKSLHKTFYKKFKNLYYYDTVLNDVDKQHADDDNTN